MATANDILNKIKDEEIEWVDLRFTDPKGKWQHLTMVASVMGEDEFTDGLMFDGSSIEGWKAINESDMVLKPDLDAIYTDPFSATPMLIVFCDVVEPSTGELYAREPRSTAKRAEAYLKTTGVGDTVYVGPEAEFFMFDNVQFDTNYAESYFKIDDIELPTNTGREYEGGNLGHRPRAKGGYFPVAPVDSAVDIRGEMVSTMLEMGLPCDKHHHEVAAAQHELGLTFGTLTQTADRMQIYKYVVHQVAHAYGKSATFMPKPIKEDNGSGMHTHFSIWSGKTPLFAGEGYAGLSEMCLYFIGGIIKHAKAVGISAGASGFMSNVSRCPGEPTRKIVMQFRISALAGSTAPAASSASTEGRLSPARPADPASRKLRRVTPWQTGTRSLPIWNMIKISQLRGELLLPLGHIFRRDQRCRMLADTRV